MKVNLKNLDIGNVSDGYHTFDELYEHRCALFLRLCSCLCRKFKCLRIVKHYQDWDLIVLELMEGQISYHIPTETVERFIERFPIKFDSGDYNYDGHTSNDVVMRLMGLSANLKGE